LENEIKFIESLTTKISDKESTREQIQQENKKMLSQLYQQSKATGTEK